MSREEDTTLMNGFCAGIRTMRPVALGSYSQGGGCFLRLYSYWKAEETGRRPQKQWVKVLAASRRMSVKPVSSLLVKLSPGWDSPRRRGPPCFPTQRLCCSSCCQARTRVFTLRSLGPWRVSQTHGTARNKVNDAERPLSNWRPSVVNLKSFPLSLLIQTGTLDVNSFSHSRWPLSHTP